MNTSARVLVTGATGFIGKALVQTLADAGFQVILATRRVAGEIDGRENRLFLLNEDVTPSLEDIDVVIHTAARAHVLKETSRDPAREFRIQNADATRRLARAAAQAGVKRFIFLSSIGVNGSSTPPGQAFRADDIPAPVEPYAVSKLQAEEALCEEASGSGMEWVIIRPPLVYGPGARGNVERMCRGLLRRCPLPFGAIQNSRSFVAIGNLISLIERCMAHPLAPMQVFMVSDGIEHSTAGWFRLFASGLNVPALLVPVPVNWLRRLGCLVGRGKEVDKFSSSLVVDIHYTQERLGWKPPQTPEQAIIDMFQPHRAEPRQ